MENSAGVKFDCLDPEDQEAINVFLQNSQFGFFFSVYSSPNKDDASELWNEARIAVRNVASGQERGAIETDERALGAFRETRLGCLCNKILEMGDVAAVALVTAGIDEAIAGSIEHCMLQIAFDVQLPWHASPDHLYICCHESCASPHS